MQTPDDTSAVGTNFQHISGGRAMPQAVILAGGLGTRLRTTVPDLPKCMARVAGKPFLFYVIHFLLKQNINNIILSLGYKHEIIRDYITEHFNSLDVTYAIENSPLGTGGAIKLSCEKATTEHVIVVNGDTIFDVDLNKLIGFHYQKKGMCTLALKPMTDFDRYGGVSLKDDQSINQFMEKKWYASGLINGGVYALDVARFLAIGLPNVFSFEKDFLERPENNNAIFGLVQDAYFIDIGIPTDYHRAQTEFESRNS